MKQREAKYPDGIEAPKFTGNPEKRSAYAGASNLLDKNGERRNLEMINGHKPVDQLEAYKTWAKTKGLKRTFIAYYSECGSLIIACNMANVHPSAVKQWLLKDEDFRDDYDVATDMAVAILEHEARRRALSGSDRLLEFLLRSLKPEVYREKYEIKQEITSDYIIDISTPRQTLITPAINDAPAIVLE